MVHFGVPLMVDFRMRALDESLLLIYWNQDSLPSVAVRWNGQQSMRVSLHHHQLAILFQMPLGDVMPKKLLTYPRVKRGLSLLPDEV